MDRSIIKPVVGSRVNWGHPIAKDMGGCWLFNERAGTGKNYGRYSRSEMTLTGANIGWGTRDKGSDLVYSATTGTSYAASGDTTHFDFDRTDQWSMEVLYMPLSTAVAGVCGNGNAGGTIGIFLKANSAANKFQIFFTGSGSNNWIIADSTNTCITTSAWNHIIVTYDGSSVFAGFALYVNGINIPLTNTASTLTTSTKTGVEWTIGRLGANTTGSINGDRYAWNRVWSRKLQANEAEQLYHEPWGMFQQPRIMFVQPPSSTITVDMWKPVYPDQIPHPPSQARFSGESRPSTTVFPERVQPDKWQPVYPDTIRLNPPKPQYGVTVTPPQIAWTERVQPDKWQSIYPDQIERAVPPKPQTGFSVGPVSPIWTETVQPDKWQSIYPDEIQKAVPPKPQTGVTVTPPMITWAERVQPDKWQSFYPDQIERAVPPKPQGGVTVTPAMTSWTERVQPDKWQSIYPDRIIKPSSFKHPTGDYPLQPPNTEVVTCDKWQPVFPDRIKPLPSKAQYGVTVSPNITVFTETITVDKWQSSNLMPVRSTSTARLGMGGAEPVLVPVAQVTTGGIILCNPNSVGFIGL